MNIPKDRDMNIPTMLYLSPGEEALTPLLHLGPQHLAPAALIRIRHLLSSVTDAVLTLRMKVV